MSHKLKEETTRMAHGGDVTIYKCTVSECTFITTNEEKASEVPCPLD